MRDPILAFYSVPPPIVGERARRQYICERCSEGPGVLVYRLSLGVPHHPQRVARKNCVIHDMQNYTSVCASACVRASYGISGPDSPCGGLCRAQERVMVPLQIAVRVGDAESVAVALTLMLGRDPKARYCCRTLPLDCTAFDD